MSGYLPATIFEYLETHGRQNRRQIIAALAVDPQTLTHTLITLQKRGKITAVGWTHRRVYSIVPGVQPPEDLRGKAPGCAVGRAIAAQNKRARSFSSPPAPHLELERCWGWMARIVEPFKVDMDGQSCVNPNVEHPHVHRKRKAAEIGAAIFSSGD